MRRRLILLGLASAASVASGCGSPAPTVAPSPSPHPTTSATAAAPTATPVAVAPGPYALLITNDNRQGSTYDALLVNDSGTIVSRVTAKLPLLKSNQTLTVSPVSAGSTHAYYLDGDTDIHSLAPDGTTAPVKTISAGTTSELAFAVDPTEQRLAVSVITEQSDATRSTGHGYIENLADSGSHSDIFNNTGYDSFRWPIAWYGNNVIDAIGAYDAGCRQGGYGIQGQTSGIPCAASIHVINATTQNRVATICESPTVQPSSGNVQASLEGLNTAAGVACFNSQYSYNSLTGASASTCSLVAVSWTGTTRRFGVCSPSTVGGSGGSFNENTCFLSPDGARMACTADPSQALTLLTPGGAPHSLGRRYHVLGWIDAAHLMVDVDSTTLAVLNVDTGVATTVSVPSADHVTMQGVVGGS